MKTSNLLRSILAAAFVLTSAGSAFASEWTLDPTHVTAQFSIKHLMVATVRGQFDKVSGTLNFDDKDPTKSVVDISIETKSINTREAKRDEHLRSADFFDAAGHPAITFKSTKVSKAGKNKFKVVGDLTMRGVTKPVTLDVTLTDAVKSPWGQSVRGVSASGKLNRKDWGLVWNKGLETGGVLVGDEVELNIDAEFVQKS
jgi:polyisoprenoid-binding protein YceI